MVSYQSPFESSYVQCDFCGRDNVPRHLSNANEPNICSDCLNRIKWQREKSKVNQNRNIPPPIYPLPQPDLNIPPPIYPWQWPDIQLKNQDSIPHKPSPKLSSARGLTKCSCGTLFEGFFIEKENSKFIAICPRCQKEYEVRNKPNRGTKKTEKASNQGLFQFIASAFRGV